MPFLGVEQRNGSFTAPGATVEVRDGASEDVAPADRGGLGRVFQRFGIDYDVSAYHNIITTYMTYYLI